MSVCMYVQGYGTWSTNGWSDQDGGAFFRCAGRAERRWCQLQTDQLHVARAMCHRASPYKKSLAKGAGQINGQVRPELYGPKATVSWLVPLW